METDVVVKESMLLLIQQHRESEATENKLDSSKDMKNQELSNTKEMMVDLNELKNQFESLVNLKLKLFKQAERFSHIKSYIVRIQLLIDYLKCHRPKPDSQLKVKEETKQSADNKRSGSPVGQCLGW